MGYVRDMRCHYAAVVAAAVDLAALLDGFLVSALVSAFFSLTEPSSASFFAFDRRGRPRVGRVEAGLSVLLGLGAFATVLDLDLGGEAGTSVTVSSFDGDAVVSSIASGASVAELVSLVSISDANGSDVLSRGGVTGNGTASASTVASAGASVSSAISSRGLDPSASIASPFSPLARLDNDSSSSGVSSRARF